MFYQAEALRGRGAPLPAAVPSPPGMVVVEEPVLLDAVTKLDATLSRSLQGDSHPAPSLQNAESAPLPSIRLGTGALALAEGAAEEAVGEMDGYAMLMKLSSSKEQHFW